MSIFCDSYGVEQVFKHNFKVALIIPEELTSDIHICGCCKLQFVNLESFIEHKQTIHGINVTCLPAGNYEKQQQPESVTVIEPKISFDGAKLNLKLTPDTACDTIKPTTDLSPKALLDCVPPNDITQSDVVAVDQDGKSIFDGTFSYKREKLIFRCEFAGCTYEAGKKSDVERHASVHTRDRPFQCDKCPKTFKRRDKLQDHCRRHSDGNAYQCKDCSYQAYDSSALTKHARIHTGERPFKCPMCSYRSRNSSQLSAHIRTHTGDKPYPCTYEKCKATFKTSNCLKRHQMVHADEKKFSCPDCPFKTNFAVSLNKHLQCKHSEESNGFTCNRCDPPSEFSSSRKLTAHVKKFHNNAHKEKKKLNESSGEVNSVRTYVCLECRARFVSQFSLETHRRYHRVDPKSIEKNSLDQTNCQSKDVNPSVANSSDRKSISPRQNFEKRDISDGLLGSEQYIVDQETFEELRTAELLASLNQHMQGSRGLFEISSNILSSMSDELQSGEPQLNSFQ